MDKRFLSRKIWDLENKVKAASDHLKNFKARSVNFDNPSKRVKGVDTVFYDLNYPNWRSALQRDLSEFREVFGEDYDRGKVSFK